MSHKEKTKIGWREWVALPSLGIVMMRAKIDTGAQTSSIHATNIKLITNQQGTIARFTLAPYTRYPNIQFKCEANVVDLRYITSSNGKSHERVVIETELKLNEKIIKTEVTLNDRSKMKYKILIGRTALKKFLVDPAQSFLYEKTQEEKNFLQKLKEDYRS